MPLPRAVLFDLDGVLVRSYETWFRTVEQSGVRFRGRAITREEFEPTFGQGTRADVTHFGLACTVEELDRFYVETFPKYPDGIWVDPAAAPLLDALAVRGVKRAVVTNTVSPLARTILRAGDLLERFERIACADFVANPKPAPDLLIHALGELGLAASQAWMIGDSRYDREAAQAAGVPFVGYRLDGGDVRIEQLPELLALVDRASR